jgi:murein L,D-transpeptidase YcbB/YkuD
LALEDAAFAALPAPTAGDREDAIKRFQARNGLTADGQAGAPTLAALNVPASRRVGQILANMERWRWLPASFERRYIVVNVPDQNVAYVRDGETVLTSRAIVGKKLSRTPILRTEVRSVVANPPWNVPGDIAAKQLLPQLRRNPNYLKSRNMVLVNGPADDPQGRTINWKNVAPGTFPYRIQQLPGDNSALGQVMLDMPNDFDVYLHDTPGKALFKQPNRELSNGCVRVEDIFALASLAIADDADTGGDAIRAAIASGETQHLDVGETLPVYLVYWTAIAGEDGTVGFRPDRYGRDQTLIAALRGIPLELMAER